ALAALTRPGFLMFWCSLGSVASDDSSTVGLPQPPDFIVGGPAARRAFAELASDLKPAAPPGAPAHRRAGGGGERWRYRGLRPPQRPPPTAPWRLSRRGVRGTHPRTRARASGGAVCEARR